MSISTEVLSKIEAAQKGHLKSHDVHIGYGTAGFRTKETLLDHVMFRMGIVAALRSSFLKKKIGVMITASHNPEGDNGVKLIDPKGEMLAADWEKISTLIANAPNESLVKEVDKIVQSEKIDLTSFEPNVFIGRDTRGSSPSLSSAVIDGVKSVNGSFVDYGIVSTPILHFMVVCGNYPQYGDFNTQKTYYLTLSTSFNKIMSLEGKSCKNYVPSVVIDGANGVGSLVAQEISKFIPSEILQIKIVNDCLEAGKLNHQCGADYVKVHQKPPKGLNCQNGTKFVSFDGDADRIIYFYFDETDKFRMLDGDKIAVLFALHLSDLVQSSSIQGLKLGLVQSAYANGSSTNYIQNVLGVPVSCTLTGVKHLHHEALKYDIGIYFEANGHGTVVFSPTAITSIQHAASDETNKSAIELLHFTTLINSYVGDALSDMLAVEAMLKSKDWSISQWDSLYNDLPSRQLKVNVKDRNLILTENAEREVREPIGVQGKINEIVGKFRNGRSFVRPSGTEDVVRVYAEADTQENADKLGSLISQLVYDECGGIGDRP